MKRQALACKRIASRAEYLYLQISETKHKALDTIRYIVQKNVSMVGSVVKTQLTYDNPHGISEARSKQRWKRV